MLKYVLENGVVENCSRVGKYLKDKLEGLKSKHDFIVEVRGRGLLLAVEFSGEVAEQVVNRCLGEGLLLNMVKPNAVRFMPPLIITEGDVDEAMGIVEEVLPQVELPRQ